LLWNDVIGLLRGWTTELTNSFAFFCIFLV
jgi:hypothetical protein